MKKNIVFLFCLLFIACNRTDENDLIVIDLDKNILHLNYSHFVDSLSYLVLNTDGNGFLAEIEKIYFDEDLIIVKGQGRE